MPYNFRPVERDQQYLLAPSIRDWLPEDDLAWLVLDVVDELDLEPLRARHRPDGWGAPAYDPALMTALLVYAYATGERSSRRIEARCRQDVAYRVICANQIPDHATIARFRVNHEAAFRGLFSEILRLCAAAGLGALGLVALDGTKLAADASASRNRTADQLDAEIAKILAEAAATDAAEDEALGPDRRGDELPAGLADRGGRRARFSEARRQLAEADAERLARYEADLARRAEIEARTGRRAGGRAPKPDAVHRRGWSERNTTDPDSRKMKARGGWVQGYNGQAVVAADGLILAAELTQQSGDVDQLEPMIEAATANVRAAGFARRLGITLADGGYWSDANLAAVETAGRVRVLIKPNPGKRRRPGSRRPEPPGRARMRQRLARPRAAALYKRRGAIVEAVFGQLKEVRGIRRFRRRGYTACASEWQLLCATHNLLKLWRRHHRPPPTGGGPGRSRQRRRERSAGDRPTRSVHRRRGLRRRP